jgi:carboxymethylenebutenolidase
MSQTIELIAADGARIPAYVARPAGQPKGGLVVAQEIFGVNRHIRAVADGYAQDGYLAVAPHMFHRVQPGADLGYAQQDIVTGAGYKQKTDVLPAPGIAQDMQAAIDYAVQESGGKAGIVGYCWGGLLAWRAACELKGLSAAVTYYGGGITTVPKETARQPQVPVLSHFAERDQHIPVSGVEAFQKLHPEVQVYLYPADHGFNCDLRGAWEPESAKLALQRTLAFLAKYVG